MDASAATVPVGYLVKRLQALVHDRLTEALAPHDLSLSKYAVLVAIDEKPGLSNAELARRTFVVPQTTHRVVQDLEHDGLVERRAHPTHGRVLQAQLTDAGHRKLADVAPSVDAVEQRMLTGMSPRAVEELRRGLQSCITQLE
jgi:DNA-binding MarR family transcriptional regulator